MTLRKTVINASSSWTDAAAPETDVVVSSRIRVARNLADRPFPHLLSVEEAQQIIDQVQQVMDSTEAYAGGERFTLIKMEELTPVERQILVEKHLISPQLLEHYEKKAVVLRDDELVSVMVNEEDHLRIQSLMPGLQLAEAWGLVNSVDDWLEKYITYAFSEQLGYLTTCPTNVGTGLRASVMVHLPGLVLAGQLRGVLITVAKLGLTARGLYGEGTEATGNLFQISNQITLGHSEEDIINNLFLVTRQLMAQERTAREALFSERREQLEDKVGRAYGLLRHARLITAEEAMRLLSDLRLGVYLDLTKAISSQLVTELMLLSRPAFLAKMSGQDMNMFQLNLQRASLIRQKFADISGGE